LPFALLASWSCALLCPQLWRVAVDVNLFGWATLKGNLASIRRSGRSRSWLEEVWIRQRPR
jgi:hypothetical protein